MDLTYSIQPATSSPSLPAKVLTLAQLDKAKAADLPHLWAGYSAGEFSTYTGASVPASRAIIALANGATLEQLPSPWLNALRGLKVWKKNNLMLPASGPVNLFHGVGRLSYWLGYLQEHPTTIADEKKRGPLTGLTFAGFTNIDISNYMGVSPLAASAIIAMGSGKSLKSLPLSWQIAVAQIPKIRFDPRYAGSHTPGKGDIPWGLQHLAEHPAGSHYHGDFNVTDVILSVATGGLYAQVKAFANIAQGGSLIDNAKLALASNGIGGSALTPIVGVNKSLAIQGAVAAAAGGFALASSGSGLSAGAASIAKSATGLLAPLAIKAVTSGGKINPTMPASLSPGSKTGNSFFAPPSSQPGQAVGVSPVLIVGGLGLLALLFASGRF